MDSDDAFGWMIFIFVETIFDIIVLSYNWERDADYEY